MTFAEGDHAFRYYKRTENNPFRIAVEHAARLVSSRPATAVDLACGSLSDAKGLADMGFRVKAVDANPLVRNFRRRHSGSDIRLTISIAETYDLPPGSVDLVNMQMAMQFFPKPVAWNLFCKIGRWLKPNGVLTANAVGEFDSWNTPGSSLSFYSASELESMLAEAGFTILVWQGNAWQEEDMSGKVKFWDTIEFTALNPPGKLLVHAGNP